MKEGKVFCFHHGWHFLLADEFPMQKALEKHKDKNGRCFYELDYIEENWERVTLPHTFNDTDLFRDRIKDAGSGQKRTAAFYRNYLTVPKEYCGQKVLIEFEGIRQTCYLYVNGKMVGYVENGVAPFGFDLTPFIDYDKPNLIAVATDNTATRETDFCIAETPNKPDVIPGSYLFPQDKEVDKACEGVGYFWNCNDFNPSVGGITRPVKIHFKPKVHLTLPLYSNLMTKGTYIYGSDFDIQNGTSKINVESEIRNESGKDVKAYIEIIVKNIDGEEVMRFKSDECVVNSTSAKIPPLSITPTDAYIAEILPDGRKHYTAVNDESKLGETVTKSLNVTEVSAVSDTTKLNFWSISNPFLYRAEVRLFADGELCDSEVIETGFRKVGYDKDRGVLLNDVPVWLRGYAQRATNEWATIGIAPEWLKDVDAMLIKESNANHIRFMHVAGSKADVRSFDRHGIVCTQPAGDKERENFGRQWKQRVELMRDVIIAFRNSPSILFWEAGNNSINKEHMAEMRAIKEKLDPSGGRFMGCRTLNTEDVIEESEFVGTMLNRHAARFTAEHGPIMETEYLREEAPRRIWDDFSPPDFDYKTKWGGKGGRKQVGIDFYDMTSEDLALASAKGYGEFFNDRIGGASKKDYYSGCAALCWTDSAQHGRQAYSENARMSGRVDAVRNKKQSFDVFRVMQSPKSAVKIFGHRNYPKADGDNYKYNVKKFNGTYWEETGETNFRDAHNKTVYVIGSYDIAKIVLKVNGREVGVCDKTIYTFVFPFPNIDITESGEITAYGYDCGGNLVANDTIKTVGEPSQIHLTLHTDTNGLKADGNDVAYVDIEVTDENGDICPLCYDKIDFEFSGDGVFLGGYNSGKFDFEDKHESVIHKNYVYAECGTNRVFIRSTENVGKLKLKANMNGITAEIKFESVETKNYTLTECTFDGIYEDCKNDADRAEFEAIEKIDKIKYIPESEPYCKILVNGQEPDTRGVRSLNKNGRIWGAVICILERLKTEWSEHFDFEYNSDEKILTLKSGEYVVTAECGRTHLRVNGNENLMDGEPYISDSGQFVMEVSAIASYIDGVSAWYDDKVEVFRIETKQ